MKHHAKRITINDRASIKKLDYSCVTFPVEISEIKRIEKQNSININVFGYNGSVYPIRIFKENHNDQMELLVIKEEGKNTMSISKILID